MIRLQNLTYGEILRDLTLSVAPGEILTLIGGRGSGKTTLLRVLAGLLRPTAGTATVAGVDCGSPAVRRKIGLVSESLGLYQHLTVRENLLLTARLWALPSARVDAVLPALDLESIADRRAGKLSPGEAGRVRMARAILHDPPALLLDEPMGDLDKESATTIAFAITEAAEGGKAVLVATFGAPRAIEIATRTAYLEGGRLATPSTVSAPEIPLPESPIDLPKLIAARKGERTRLIAPAEIRYAYAQEKAVFIETESGLHAVNFTLSDLEERLSGEGFFRCHRGFLVNLTAVREVAAWTRDSYSLILKDGKEVPLSKYRAQELKKRIGL